MSETLVRLYRRLDDAEAARQALIELGFAADNLRLSAQGDEAGAIRGNFILGDPPRDSGPTDDGSDCARHCREVEFGALFLLSVQVSNQRAADTAIWLMERFHGKHVDAPGDQHGLP